jgi:hypothetical protein
MGHNNEATIREILRYPAACSTAELSKRLGVSQASIYMVRAGKVWSHIAPELPRREGAWSVKGGSEFQRKQEAQVRLIIEGLAHLPADEAAVEAGCSVYWVKEVRSGRRLSHVLPELPRVREACPGRGRRMPDERQVEMVGDILRSRGNESQSALARRYGVSRQYINQILQGKALAHVLPELPRGVTGDRCAGCVHGVKPDRCGLGFPEGWTIDAWDCPAFVCLGSRALADA